MHSSVTRSTFLLPHSHPPPSVSGTSQTLSPLDTDPQPLPLASGSHHLLSVSVAVTPPGCDSYELNAHSMHVSFWDWLAYFIHSALQNEAPPPLTVLTVTLRIPATMNPLSVSMCLFWTFHINGITHCIASLIECHMLKVHPHCVSASVLLMAA